MRPIRHLPIADLRAHAAEDALSAASSRGAVAEASSSDAAVSLAEDRDAGWEGMSSLSFEGDGEGEKLLQVGDIAKASGKTVRAIHHYEEVGLLQPHARSKGRYRLYDQAALTRVRWIGKLHDLGLSLAQIQQMLKAWETAPSAPGAMAKIRGIYLQKLEETRAQIEHLTALERELVASIDYLDTCEACDPAELVLACTNCNVHDRTQQEPDLVAGIHGGHSHCRHTASR